MLTLDEELRSSRSVATGKAKLCAQRGKPPFGFSTFLKSSKALAATDPPTESASPQRNCLAMFIVHCSLHKVEVGLS